MAQKLIQSQTQQQTQQLRLTQQQLLNVKLLEMPINKLEDNVKAEMDDNPALEKDYARTAHVRRIYPCTVVGDILQTKGDPA